jgi:RHS repeat-associated protein
LLGYAFSEAGLPVASLKGKVSGTNTSDTAWTLRSRKVFEGPEAVADSGHDGWIYRVGMAEFRTDSTGAWKPLFVTTDPVGTTNGLVDDTGKVVAMYQLDAFGNLERYEGSVQTDYLFGGKEWDSELGLYWMGVRLYDPVAGQFTSRDALEQYRNPYSFTGGSPLDNVDPWGLETVGDDQSWVSNDPNAEGTDFTIQSTIDPAPSPTIAQGALDGVGEVAKGTAESIANKPYISPDLDAVAGIGQIAFGLYELGKSSLQLIKHGANMTDYQFGKQYTKAAIGWIGVGASVLGGAGAGSLKTTRVGRWMSKAEYEAMRNTGKVQESWSGTTHVSMPANSESYVRQTGVGNYFVEFNVPTSSLKVTNGGWAKIIGPSSLEGRNLLRKGLPLPVMPNATDIFFKAVKIR